MHRVSNKLGLILLKQLRRDMKTEIDSEEKVHLKPVHLTDQNPTDLRIVGVVVVCIVEKLSREENRCDDDSMYIELRKQKVVSLNQPVNVDQGKNKAFVRAGSVLVDSFERSRATIVSSRQKREMKTQEAKQAYLSK